MSRDQQVVVTDKAVAHPFPLQDAYVAAGHRPQFTFMVSGTGVCAGPKIFLASMVWSMGPRFDASSA